ncbi:hypothetical protein CTI12_AA439810 [Artemisia annua]|uniref:Uncharacterized protein n=1 Tax=Artemisia annua TaxID=35608 RepID=A0A2U1LYX2_ARTAN|nr:hypothetical protein CTI12_AA439810 [Artemisia annua]
MSFDDFSDEFDHFIHGNGTKSHKKDLYENSYNKLFRGQERWKGVIGRHVGRTNLPGFKLFRLTSLNESLTERNQGLQRAAALFWVMRIFFNCMRSISIFKEIVSLDQKEVHVDDFSQEDHEKKEGGPNKDDPKKGPKQDGPKKGPKKDVGPKKDGGQKDGGPKYSGQKYDGEMLMVVDDEDIDDGENVDVETENPVEARQDEDIIEVGSFTQWLEENYDVVGDVTKT